MCFAYHLAENVMMFSIIYLVIQKFTPHQVEDDDRTDGYKLIGNENDEENQV